MYQELPLWDFLGGPVVEDQSCNAGDVGSIPGRGTKIAQVGATKLVSCYY